MTVNPDSGTVTGFGYDSTGNGEISVAGAMGSNVWGSWTQDLSQAPTDTSWWGSFTGNLFSQWSWGVRGANQTYGECLAQNSGNYSVAGAFNQDGSAAKLVGGNDVASLHTRCA